MRILKQDRLIKAGFSRGLPKDERRPTSRINRGGRGIRQRRFWEHLIRDNEDYQRHMDYIHWNPVKQGWFFQVKDWPHSSFHAYVRRIIHAKHWGSEPDMKIEVGE